MAMEKSEPRRESSDIIWGRRYFQNRQRAQEANGTVVGVRRAVDEGARKESAFYVERILEENSSRRVLPFDAFPPWIFVSHTVVERVSIIAL